QKITAYASSTLLNRLLRTMHAPQVKRETVEMTAPAARSGRSHPLGTPKERLSEHAKEILQEAPRRSAESGRREIGTEHLLLALTESGLKYTDHDANVFG